MVSLCSGGKTCFCCGDRNVKYSHSCGNKAQVGAEIEYNEKICEQYFSGARQSSGVVDMCLAKKPFVYAYLSPVNRPKTMGVIKYHMLYDYRKNNDGKLVPITLGYFEQKMCLLYSGGLIDNP